MHHQVCAMTTSSYNFCLECWGKAARIAHRCQQRAHILNWFVQVSKLEEHGKQRRGDPPTTTQVEEQNHCTDASADGEGRNIRPGIHKFLSARTLKITGNERVMEEHAHTVWLPCARALSNDESEARTLQPIDFSTTHFYEMARLVTSTELCRSVQRLSRKIDWSAWFRRKEIRSDQI